MIKRVIHRMVVLYGFLGGILKVWDRSVMCETFVLLDKTDILRVYGYESRDILVSTIHPCFGQFVNFSCLDCLHCRVYCKILDSTVDIKVE